MNILTFDVEEWFLDHYKNRASKERYERYDSYLHRILDTLEENHIKASFFCVGQMATLFPDVIKLIQSRGHEIGCHSNLHTWLNKMTEMECREDTRQAIDSLEQCIGEKVKSYRAPAFSIGKNNKWVFEILVENGIEFDASIFPASRSFGGFADFKQNIPCIVKYDDIQIKEFPICMTKILGKEIAYSGGGYFRFFPLSFVEREMKKSSYAMCYFHLGDLITESRGLQSKEEYEAYFKEKGTLKARYVRYIKGNLGKKRAMGKMISLINNNSFLNIKEADCIINWEAVPIVTL